MGEKAKAKANVLQLYTLTTHPPLVTKKAAKLWPPHAEPRARGAATAGRAGRGRRTHRVLGLGRAPEGRPSRETAGLRRLSQRALPAGRGCPELPGVLAAAMRVAQVHAERTSGLLLSTRRAALGPRRGRLRATWTVAALPATTIRHTAALPATTVAAFGAFCAATPVGSPAAIRAATAAMASSALGTELPIASATDLVRPAGCRMRAVDCPDGQREVGERRAVRPALGCRRAYPRA